MNCDPKEKRSQILVWLIWLIAVSARLGPLSGEKYDGTVPVLMGIVSYDRRSGPLFPWEPKYRWKKGALVKYRAWQERYRRAKRAALLGWLALKGVLSMAEVVDRLTASQVRYHLGALPVLYRMLEELEVRQIIKWPDLRSVIMIEAQRILPDKTTTERRFYFSSLAGDPKPLLSVIRQHWGIENKLHWVLDVAFDEDRSQVRREHAPENFALIRHLALNLIKQETSDT